MIKNKAKVSRKTVVISGILATVIMISAITVSGMLNGKLINISDSKSASTVIEQNQTSEDEVLIIEETTDNDGLVSDKIVDNDVVVTNIADVGNKSVIPYETDAEDISMRKAHTYYEALDVSEDVQAEKEFKIKSSEVSEEPYVGFDRLEVKDMTSDRLKGELMESGVNQSETSSADLSRQYVASNYSYEDSLSYNNEGVKCDENGNISLYFAVNSDNLVNVQFSEAKTREDVGGYIVLANNENAYTFMGFDPDKTYDIAIKGETENTWKIEGEYIIY